MIGLRWRIVRAEEEEEEREISQWKEGKVGRKVMDGRGGEMVTRAGTGYAANSKMRQSCEAM